MLFLITDVQIMTADTTFLFTSGECILRFSGYLTAAWRPLSVI